MRRLLTVLLAAIVSTTVVLAQGGTGTTQLVGAEYFYDTDPGYGQATYINNVTEGENSLTLSVDGLSPGAHMLYVRSLESSGLWSATQSCPILLIPQRADNVVRVEYFFDTDPGYGLGSSVSATNGENVLPLSISGMAAGIHHLNLRSQDAAGNWSPTLSQSLFIVSPKNANVQRIEYFFDTDPGYGQATAISGALAADATYALPLDGLAIGSHLLCVRAQDNHGRWSSVVSTPLFVTGRPANAVAAEYFLDANDPGVGQATPVTLPADLSQPFVIAAATDGLNPGEHTITIRVLNDLGFWTTVVAGTTFTVTEPTVVTPEAYAVLSADSLTVTFYYDSQRASRSGAMDINTSFIKDYAGDSSPYGTATQAIIDPSFADYRPTSTYCWFQACDKLVSVSGMEYLHTDNVTDMGYMFVNCSNLTSLDVSHFNTENVTSMLDMFDGCSRLTSLDVSGFNTAKVTDMRNMFYGCPSLTSLDVSGFNTAKVMNMSGMFAGCTGLTSLDVSGFNTANVMDMSGMFAGCLRLTSLDVSRFNTANVAYMSHMFYNCSGLTSLDVSKFSTANVTAMNFMFYNCSALTSLDVSGFNTANVTAMNLMFYNCSGLTSLDVSGFNTANVNDMGSMFSGCSLLTSLDVSGFNTANVTDMSVMFQGCSRLTSLDVSGFNTANVNNMGVMFYGCSGLTSLDVSRFNTAKVTAMNYMFYNCSGLTSLDVSGFNTANVTDMSYMFSGCSNLVTIYAGEGWSTANVTDGSLMFHDCANLVGGAGTVYNSRYVGLEYAHIDGGESNPGYLTDKNATPYGTMEPYAVLTDNQDVIARDSTGVTYGKTLTFYYDDQKDARGGMSVGPFYDDYASWYNQRESITTAEFDPSFANCTTLTSTAYWFFECKNLVSISGIQYLKTDNVTNMRNMFGGCSLLTSLDVSGFNTANVTDMSYMFQVCSNLTSLDVSGFNTAKVTDMDYMFSYCTGLTSLDLSGFNTANVRNMNYMFSDCTGLTSLDVSGFNTANVTYMWSMFLDCSGLTSLDVSGFNTANVKDMGGMFYGCSGLTSLDVSGFNTANVTDMMYMFSNCSNLVTIYAGEGWSTANVTDGSLMFHDCANLVGGAGTVYNSRYIGLEYAHIDGGESNPGYLTDKNATPYGTMEPYAVLTDNQDVIARDSTGVTYGKTLTFYYDDQKDARGGMSVGPFYKDVWSSWYNQRESITTAEFDPSFANCTTLTSTAYWFYECKNLVSISGIQYLKTANVMDMSGMFGGCSLLTSLDVSGFNTAKVTYMGGMFYGCSSLTSLDVSGFNTANMVDMGGMFRDCSGLTSLDVTGFNTANVTYMDYMFSGCTGLTSLDVSGFNTANVTDMSYMFSGCSNLVTIYAGEGWSTANVRDGSLMFRDCTNLVGGAGTTYDANHVDYTYAHIDGGTSNPGYLTDKNASSTYKVMIAVEGNGEVSYGEPTTITGGREVETTVDAGGSLELFFFPGEDARLASVMVAGRDVTSDVTPASQNSAASYVLRDINSNIRVNVIFENVGPVGEAEFDGLVARVSGERTLDEAFAEVGGRFEAAKTIAAIVWNKDTPMTDADLQGFNNPNMLVYVENPSLAPSSAKNVVVNGRIQSLVLTDEGDNNNFFAPQPFTAEQISYTHEYIQQTQAGISRGWESIALPFTVQTITHESHGQLRPFALSGSGRPFWLRQLTSNGIIDVTGIEANTPYIISMPNNPTYRYDYNQAGRVTFAAVNARVESSYDTRVMSHENIEMVPAFYAIATGNNCYAINRSEPREGYPEGSVFELNLRTVRPFEAYTLHLGNNPLPRFLPIADMNATTGIDDITSGSEGADVKIYSLSGVIVFEGSLSEAQMKLPAGVYIIDGKKTLIK